MKSTDDQLSEWDGPFITSCPHFDFSPSLQAAAGAATSTSSKKPWVHSNLIVKDWSFVGRSYGVASSVGLLDPPSIHPVTFNTYEFKEYGYFANITCERNESATYSVIANGTVFDSVSGDVQIWTTIGSLPNSVPGREEKYVLTNRDGVNVFALSAVVNNNQSMIGIAAPDGSWYSQWNKMQCLVGFVPSQFHVFANLTSQTATVTRPVELQEGAMTIIEPTGNLTATAMYSLDTISRLNNNREISALGNALTWNVVNARNAYANLSSDDAEIRGLEDSIAAILDDILMTMGASQQVLGNDTTTTNIRGRYTALRIGSEKYISAIFGIQACLCVVLLVELCRTYFWKGLGLFDYTSTKSLVIATSAGGTGISKQAQLSLIHI